MKTQMIVTLALIGSLIGCGAGGPGSPGGGVAGPVIPTVHAYIYRVTGNGMTFAMDLIAPQVPPAQTVETFFNTPGNVWTIPDANPIDYTIGGLNTHGDFAARAGAGILSITLYKDGVPMQTKTATNGFAVHFSQDE